MRILHWDRKKGEDIMKKLTSLVALVLSIVLPVLAVAEEPAATPEPVPAEEILAYTQVYEPETSFVLS